MNVTTKLKMDLSKPDFGLSVDAVQGDSYTRSVRIALYNGIRPWNIPENVTAAIRYAKPDHTKGYYDTLPNGESAWSYQENVLTVHLAPQMLTVAGDVKTQIELIQSAHILSTFCLVIHVEPNPAAGVTKSEDYINWLQWIQDQSDEHALQVQQAAQTATQASQIASQAAENAIVSANSANDSAKQAKDAATSASISHNNTASIAAEVSAIVAGNEAYTKQESNDRYSPVILQTTSGNPSIAIDSADMHFQNLRLFGKTLQNGTPTPEMPVLLESAGDSGSIVTTVRGRNLLSTPYHRESLSGDTYVSPGGVTFVKNADGSITMNGTNAGTSSQDAEYVFTNSSMIWLPAGTYTLSTSAAPFTELCWYMMVGMYSGSIDSENNSKSTRGGSIQFAITEPGYAFFVIRVNIDKTVENVTVYPQVEVGATATEYAQPIETQTLTISTPNGLPGIPVTSGGNYTDENGQQWICDEVDFEKGLYIQRVDTILLDGVTSRFTFKSTATNTNSYRIAVNDSKIFMLRTGGNNEKPAILSDRFTAISYNERNSGAVGINLNTQTQSENTIWCTFGANNITTLAEANAWLAENNTTVMYALPAPKYNNLSEMNPDALTQYAALHTFYPHTTILNNTVAEMELKYVADTKLYIDQKFAGLASAIVNNM